MNTTKQHTIIKMVQNKKWLEWKTNTFIRGDLSFETTPIGDKVMVTASDSASVFWPTKSTLIILVIGSRGGIIVRHVSQN